MKKLVTILLSALVLVSLTACSSGPKLKEDHSMYLITDVGTIDDKSFNQGSYEGMKQYAHEIGVTPNYIRPSEKSDNAYLDAIEQAVEKGAKVIVTPGFLFEPAVYKAQDKYPDVKFILVDGVPQPGDYSVTKVADNTVSILYREEQSGFLAGYAAVKAGYTKLGFMGGMAVPAVVNFGYGYLAGANLAAEEMGVKVTARYTYLGDFIPKPEFQTQAAAWYNDGVEVIFASAGGAGNSVMSAAEEADKKVIGVDVDQVSESDTVITSAMKDLRGSVYDAVKKAMTEGFPGGQTLLLGVKEKGVQLPEDFSRLDKFTKADYDAIYTALVDDKDGIASGMPTLASHGDKASVLIGHFDNITLEVVGE
jgi:basic membrane protein A and related proteins